MKTNGNRFLCLVILLLMISSVFAACEKNPEDTESVVNEIKQSVDALYTGEIKRENEIIPASEGKKYKISGDGEYKNGILTDRITASDKKETEKWEKLDFSAETGEVDVIIDLGGETDGICFFSFNNYMDLPEKIYIADEIAVLVSSDGSDFSHIGIMNRVAGENELFKYELPLSGTIKASYVMFKFKSTKSGSVCVDELVVYAVSNYKSEAEELVKYESFYGGEMPEKVDTPVLWDSGDADYNVNKNLVLGKIPQAFTMKAIISASQNSSKTDLKKLTDGIRASSGDYNSSALFWSYCADANTDGRLFIFDLEKTSAITGFRTGFCKNSGAGVALPECYSVYVSENGVVWDVVYRRNGIRALETRDNALIAIEDEFEAPRRARFVAVFFDINGNTRFDQIEIYGVKSVEGAVPVSEKGDTKFNLGSYIQPEDINGVHDILLMYHCYANTVKEGEPVQGGFTEEQCLAWIAYTDKEKEITDFYFDTFLYIPGGGTENWKKSYMWEAYLDNLFIKDYNLDALNKAAGTAKETLNDSGYKVKVIFSMFLPGEVYKDFGSLGGREIDFSKLDDKKAAIDWLMDQYITRFNAGKYQNLELVGFYWLSEEISYRSDVTIPDAIRHTADRARSLGYMTFSCPYMCSGFYDWYFLGFDAAFLQPSYAFFNSNKTNAIPETAFIAKSLGMGVEMEVERNAVVDMEKLMNYYQYIKCGYDYGYMNASHMYYYSLPFYDSCYNNVSFGRQLYEMNYKFVKGTLDYGKRSESAGETFECAKDGTINKSLNIASVKNTLYASVRYGSLKITGDGKFTYSPLAGFEGEDSFTIESFTAGAGTVYYEIKINVK